MNDEYWGEPGWSPDGDVDDAGGVPASNGGLGGFAGGSGLRPITSGIRPADRPTTLSQAVAENVRLEAARVGVTQAGLARLSEKGAEPRRQRLRSDRLRLFPRLRLLHHSL